MSLLLLPCVFVSRGAHCASGAANDQSNPNLQVAWQRLQPLLPPLITTGNQLACHTRSARHETSPGSSATQCGLGKSRRALLKGQGGHGSPISIPPPPPLTPLQGRRAADLQPHQQIIFRFSFGCASVYLIPGECHIALRHAVSTLIAPHARLQKETDAFSILQKHLGWVSSTPDIHKCLQSQSTRTEVLQRSSDLQQVK